VTIQPAGSGDPRHIIRLAVEGGFNGIANRSLLLVSGGEKAGDEAMLDKARQSMEAGATGFIFGRNVFQRGHDESLRLVAQ